MTTGFPTLRAVTRFIASGYVASRTFTPPLTLDQGEIDRFAETFYKGALDTHDRARLEGLVRHAVARFEMEDDEGRQEEFRQLLKSYMRFYSFVAQVIRLGDTGLEKLYTYAVWLYRLLPNRDIPADIDGVEALQGG